MDFNVLPDVMAGIDSSTGKTLPLIHTCDTFHGNLICIWELCEVIFHVFFHCAQLRKHLSTNVALSALFVFVSGKRIPGHHIHKSELNFSFGIGFFFHGFSSRSFHEL